MNTKEKNEEHAVVLCGHGSRNQKYLNDFLHLEKKINLQFKSAKIYHCFIEINRPSIEECLNNLIKTYKKIFFFPLLLFEGKHLVKDIQGQLEKLSKNTRSEIILIDKVSLTKEILPKISGILSKYFRKKNFDILITSCSKSVNRQVSNELKLYTETLSRMTSININFFHFVGEEEYILQKIKEFENKSINILLHPIFFFKGYLYEKNIKNISNLFKITCLKPLSHYDEVVNIITRKLISRI